MAWTLTVSFLVGAILAVRMPVLIFTLIVLGVMVAYALTSVSTGTSVLISVACAFLFAAVLEAGYLCSHGLFYLLYVRQGGEERR